MIAEVMPARLAMERKAAFRPWRLGRPKLTFDAPQVLLTLSSSFSRRSRWKADLPALPKAPIGMTRGSTTMSLGLMP